MDEVLFTRYPFSMVSHPLRANYQIESSHPLATTHGEDVELLEEDDVDQEAERHHGDDEDGDAPADHVGPEGVGVAARLERLPAVPAQAQDQLQGVREAFTASRAHPEHAGDDEMKRCRLQRALVMLLLAREFQLLSRS